MKNYLALMLLLALAFQPAVLLAEEVAVPAPAVDAAAVVADEATDELTEGEDWDLGLEGEDEDEAEKKAEDLKLEAPAV